MKLHLLPSSSGYAAQRNPEILEQQLDGGAPRIRKDVLDANFTVDVTWEIDGEAYDYLNAFYRTGTDRGSLPFTIDLVLDKTGLVEYTAQFIANSFKLTAQTGDLYTVSAQLSVTPVFSGTEATDDAAIIAAYVAAHP